MRGDEPAAAEVDRRVRDLRREIETDPFVFDRRFLFRCLSMGHSQFAEIIGARGPNTQINAACASTTQAVALAEDWIRAGRCRRVVVVSADNVTSDNLLPWVASGFLTSAQNRMALLEAVNIQEIFKEVFTGRATVAQQAYPAHMMPAGDAAQNIPYNTTPLANLVKSLPAGERVVRQPGKDAGRGTCRLPADDLGHLTSHRGGGLQVRLPAERERETAGHFRCAP